MSAKCRDYIGHLISDGERMPIPPFTIDGVLPPYVGPSGPGGAFEDLSPYEVSATEVVATLGATQNRQDILRNWLAHRGLLRDAGIQRGFQWLDGSFLEQKEPNDLDVVSFFIVLRMPLRLRTGALF